MNNNQHLLNVNAIDSIRGKLEYCVDNGITSENCGSELLEILEDLRDQVRENIDYNTRASEVEYDQTNSYTEGADYVTLGMDRRPCIDVEGWEVDNLGNVFGQRGELLVTEFNPKRGGLLVRHRPRGDQPSRRYMVAKLVLHAFHGVPIGMSRIMFHDQDMSNCKLENLRWINGSSSSTASQMDSLEKQQESGA